MRLRAWTTALCCAAALTGYGTLPADATPPGIHEPAGTADSPNSLAVREETPMAAPCQGGSSGAQILVPEQTTPGSDVPERPETLHAGFQQADKALLAFTSRNNRFTFTLGGSLIVRGSYDFAGAVDNIDFVPYDIPVLGDFASRQKISMDVSTSHIVMKAVARSQLLGPVLISIDADFRGGARGSYTPRIRTAYVAARGFTLGRDVTTFCDLQAAPTTIDFQCPNAYNFDFATVIRYEVDFAREHMRFGVACEFPAVSGTYNDNFAPIPQRMPDFPFYLRYAWGADLDSHIRATGVIRNLYMHNLLTGSNTSRIGWGAQLSGSIRLGRPFRLFFNGTCGYGITPYILDLIGSGLDFAPDPANPARMQTIPMWGGQAALQISLSKRLFMTGGYSAAGVGTREGSLSPDEYRRGQYIFGNMFFALTPLCTVAAEYLHGTRENMDRSKGSANRISLQVHYNF